MPASYTAIALIGHGFLHELLYMHAYISSICITSQLKHYKNIAIAIYIYCTYVASNNFLAKATDMQ